MHGVGDRRNPLPMHVDLREAAKQLHLRVVHDLVEAIHGSTENSGSVHAIDALGNRTGP